MRKRLMAIILCLVMTANLVACGSTDSTKLQELENEIEELEAEIEELEEEIEELEEENEELRAQNRECEEQTEEAATLFVSETSGVCGANMTWEYGNGVLKIHGTGEMTEFNPYRDRPWEDIKNKIQHICIDDGITSIGASAFYDMPLLSKIVIPTSIEEISATIFGIYVAEAESVVPGVEISDEMRREGEKEQILETLNSEFPEIKEIVWGNNKYTSWGDAISVIY